jgi:hypothetical protein
VAIADSGAQTCACGVDVIQSLGLDEHDLIPTSHRILGITMTAMNIAGVSKANDIRQQEYIRILLVPPSPARSRIPARNIPSHSNKHQRNEVLIRE